MARIIGIGETIYNILMRQGKPVDGMPGGDIFNTMISLGRSEADASFISEVADDRLGRQIYEFMQHNGVKTDFMYSYRDGSTPLSLSYLNADGSADCDYYLNYPSFGRLDVVWPRIDNDDFIFFGSQYVLQQEVRQVVVDILTYATERKAIVMYDPKLKHLEPGQVVWLMPSIIENLEFSDVVRIDEVDMLQMYKSSDVSQVYHDHIQFYCPVFIALMHDGHVELCTPSFHKAYPVPSWPQESESHNLIGVGDALNAGILRALDCRGVKRPQLSELSQSDWDEIIGLGMQYSAAVAGSAEAFIPFA